MDKPVAAAIVLAVLALLLVLMLVGWRSRARGQHHFAGPARRPTDVGALIGSFDGFYVATTLADQPLERVVVGGLGFRARAAVSVFERGIELGLAGGEPVFIDLAALRGADRATWAIDRVVEPDGLARVRWVLADDVSRVEVDSYLRLPAPTAFIAAADRIVPPLSTAPSKSGNQAQ